MNDPWHFAAIALGANLGDRESTLRSALAMIEALASVRDLRLSSLHATSPVIPGDSGAAPIQPDYLNAAATLSTTSPPRELLDELQRIERAHGRVRYAADRWGARTLDLDLLLYDDCVIDEPGMAVPHPRMHERLFVLAPLAEVAPDWRHPVIGATIQALFDQASSRVPTT